MHINKSFYLVMMMALVVSLGLVGCGKKTTEPDVADTAGVGPAESLDTKEELEIMEGRTSGPMLPVYFAFDKSSIDGDQVQRLERNGDFLKKNSGVKIRIEGNCDPRGTRDYNLALGERRAQGAKSYLMNQGVSGDRLQTISWGEEKLLLFGHDEISWAQNRRADFVIIE